MPTGGDLTYGILLKGFLKSALDESTCDQGRIKVRTMHTMRTLDLEIQEMRTLLYEEET